MKTFKTSFDIESDHLFISINGLQIHKQWNSI